MKTIPGSIRAFLALLFVASAQAATVTQSDPAAGGIGYTWTVNAGLDDSGSFSRHVGAWSWQDETFLPDIVGWTHTSDWVALTLTNPVLFTLSLARDPNVLYAGPDNVGGFAAVDNMFPSFTLWQNWDNDGTDYHTYNNQGNVSWAEDLSYLDSFGNSTLSSITRSWNLAAGDYTIVLGSDANSATSPPRQGYIASFSTTPEPSRAVLLVLGCALAVTRRRRK
jgi:hypothetical protein